MFGVSPAFILSGWGEGFTPASYAAGMDTVARLGFRGFQVEVFAEDRLPEWLRGGAGKVATRARELDLVCTQFVAHFMTPYLASPTMLASRKGIEEMHQVGRIVDAFPGCDQVTLPIGAFRIEPQDAPVDSRLHAELMERFAGKLAALLEVVVGSGGRLALEILPGSLPGGTTSLLDLFRILGSDRLGYNFDTGHAWACKEELTLIPSKLAGRVFGTHLCDNFSHENLSLRPGAGSIDWEPLLAALIGCGYTGSLDIEIRCPAESLEAEYRDGLAFIQSRLPRQASRETPA